MRSITFSQYIHAAEIITLEQCLPQGTIPYTDRLSFLACDIFCCAITYIHLIHRQDVHNKEGMELPYMAYCYLSHNLMSLISDNEQ